MTTSINSCMVSTCVSRILSLVAEASIGTVHSSEKAEDLDIEARSLFFTASGRIGLVLDMGKELSLHMTALQRNLNGVVKDVSGTTHKR